MKKILIVDDSEFARKQIRNFLPSSAFEIIETSNGKEALKAIFEKNLDVVILDLNMPEMNGIDVLKALREKKIKINIIVLTADIQKTTKEKCLNLGANAVVYKPTIDKVLLEEVKKLIDV